MSEPIRRVLVAGYGMMGQGIVRSFAAGGFETWVLSRDPARITDLPAGVRAVAALPDTVPDLVIETVVEKVEPKVALYRDVEARYGAGPVIATNTSGLDIQALAGTLAHPERFLAVHYLQPADAFPLVEVVRVNETAEDALERTVEALGRTGKRCVVLRRPVVGFLFNRLQHALLHEAYWMIEQGIVGAADVDAFARQAFGPRMCVTGLIEQKDLSGLETHALAQRAIVPHLHHGAEPVRILQDMYARGELGAATGKGFYDWSGRDVAAYRRRAAEKVRRILEILAED